jgi:signal transduction histidine kinase
MAREIHDTLAQGLASIVTQLEAADQSLQGGDGAAAGRRLGIARSIARESLGEVRRSMADLRPELLDGGSLPDALRRLVTRTAEETGVDARLDVPGDISGLSPGAETTLLRCAQEALANVRRHSGARSVAVTLERDAGTARLTVADDGGGFNLANRNGGAGLTGMTERVAAVDGDIEIHSAPGAGTTVAIRVPA